MALTLSERPQAGIPSKARLQANVQVSLVYCI
jgi:hypothetical protein